MNRKDTLNLYYSLQRNTLQSGSGGYHAVITHVGSVGEDEFYARAATRYSGLDAGTVRTSMEAVFSAAARILAERQYRNALDGITIELAIPGSTDAVNGTPEEGVYVAFRPSAAVRDAASGIKPVYADGDGPKIEVLSVEDMASHGQGLIVGTEPFRLAGTNISASGDGEGITVSAADGTKAVAEVEGEEGAGRYITAHLPSALPPGKGKVVLMTHGKRTPEGELHQCVKSVTIIAGETPPVTPPPELTKIYSFQHEDDTEHLYDGNSAIMEGSALGGATLKFQANSSGTWSEEIAVPSDEFEVTGTKITVDGMWLADECATLDVGYTDPVRFIVTTPNGTAMIASIWTENA